MLFNLASDDDDDGDGDDGDYELTHFGQALSTLSDIQNHDPRLEDDLDGSGAGWFLVWFSLQITNHDFNHDLKSKLFNCHELSIISSNIIGIYNIINNSNNYTII